jgi:hypothetical protein
MEPNDPIWKLLGKAPLQEPNAWFAARTVARLRREAKQPAPSLWRRLLPVSAWMGATAVVVVACVLSFGGNPPRPVPTSAELSHRAKIQDALNYIADRGAETDQWLAISNQ